MCTTPCAFGCDLVYSGITNKAFGKRRFSQKTADFRGKPQKTTGTRRKPQIGVRPLRFVPLSAALSGVGTEGGAIFIFAGLRALFSYNQMSLFYLKIAPPWRQPPEAPLDNFDADSTVWEVLNGVGADGVGVKFPIFPVKIALVCSCPRWIGENEEKRKKAKKSEEKPRKMKKIKMKKNAKKRKSLGPHQASTPTPLRTSQTVAIEPLSLWPHPSRVNPNLAN